MSEFKRVLTITDNKQSSINQSCAAKKYFLRSISDNAKYKDFIIKDYRIPNILIFVLLKIKLIKLDKCLLDFKPDLVVTCGRVTAPFSVTLKKIFKCKNIHILNPYISNSFFDLILIPNHDNFPNGKHIIKFNGALVDPDNYKLSTYERRKIYKSINPPPKKKIITVLLGGDNKNHCYHKGEINKFIRYIEQLLNNKKYFLCFLFSRRTSKLFKSEINKKFGKDSFIWKESNINPFWYLLSTSSYIIVTGDSISMTSEAIQSGNPVYIYMPKRIKKNLKNFTAIISITILQENLREN